MSATTSRAGLLFDFSVEHPEGWETREVCAHFEWTRDHLAKAIRSLRLILSGDEINLICTSQGFGQPKRYRLVGDVERATPWINQRIKGMESQLETVHAVASSLVNATDGRTVAGRKARLVDRHVGRLIEDIGDLDGRLPMRAGT